MSSVKGACLLALALALFVPACPQLLQDNFETAPRPDASLGGSAGQAGSGGGDASPCSACTADETCCDNTCVNVASDPEHCGACGSGCPGTTCSQSSCTNICLLGFVDCDKNVPNGCEVDTRSDHENCGNCAVACSVDETCSAGTCECPAGSASCDGQPGCEVNTQTDPLHCGACGQSCGANRECSAGQCACAAGFGDCDGDLQNGCETDLATSLQHCGACNTACATNQICAGSCQCGAGYQDCTNAPGCETSTNDPTHCGDCTTQCGAGTPKCSSGLCVDACPQNQPDCTGTNQCEDLTTSAEHCGQCNNPIGPNQICSGGTPTCLAGWDNCGASPGCETDLNANTSCGACGVVCSWGKSCSNQKCVCGPSTKDCNGQCQACCTDFDCDDGSGCTTDSCQAGACQNTACAGTTQCCSNQFCADCCGDSDCPTDHVCQSSTGQCVLAPCVPPEQACDGTCVDLLQSADHCGGCGRACGNGRSCSNGTCNPPWVPLSTSPLTPRKQAAFAALPGSNAVFIWGGVDANGLRQDGAIYNVDTDQWTAIPNSPVLSARVDASAVWAGNRVFVWGGGDAGTTDYRDGALFDPVSSTWEYVDPALDANTPSVRRAPYLVHTGPDVLLWGGYLANGSALASVNARAYRFSLMTQTWSAAGTQDQPPTRTEPTVGWSGTEFYVWGGRSGPNELLDGSVYDVYQDTWSPLPQGPSARYGAFGLWGGSELLVWAGRVKGANPVVADGMRYDGAWASVNPAGPARYVEYRHHGWTAYIGSSRVLVLGGIGAGLAKDGAIYEPNNTWTPVPAWSLVHDYRYSVAVFSGTEFVLWGGEDQGVGLTAEGERYRP